MIKYDLFAGGIELEYKWEWTRLVVEDTTTMGDQRAVVLPKVSTVNAIPLATWLQERRTAQELTTAIKAGIAVVGAYCYVPGMGWISAQSITEGNFLNAVFRPGMDTQWPSTHLFQDNTPYSLEDVL